MKYVLYGLGKVGNRLFHLLGSESVLAFIDREKCGSKAYGKPVLSDKQLKPYLESLSTSDVLIIIASLNHEYVREMMQTVQKLGIKSLTCHEVLDGMGQALYNRYHERGFLCVFDNGIGDAALTCAFLPAYFQKHNIKHRLALCAPNRCELCASFQVFDEIIALQDYELLALTMYLADKDFLSYQAINSIFENPEFIERLRSLGMAEQLMKKDCYLLYLGLPKDTAWKRPLLRHEEDVLPYISGYDLRPGRTVVLIPQAYTCQTFASSFWLALASKLTLKGFDVCFNCPETYDTGKFPKLMPPLSVMSALVKYAGGCISMQCGLADFLLLSGCQITVIYIRDDRHDEAYNPRYRTQDDVYYTDSYVIAESSLYAEQAIAQAMEKIVMQMSCVKGRHI